MNLASAFVNVLGCFLWWSARYFSTDCLDCEGNTLYLYTGVRAGETANPTEALKQTISVFRKSSRKCMGFLKLLDQYSAYIILSMYVYKQTCSCSHAGRICLIIVIPNINKMLFLLLAIIICIFLKSLFIVSFICMYFYHFQWSLKGESSVGEVL